VVQRRTLRHVQVFRAQAEDKEEKTAQAAFSEVLTADLRPQSAALTIRTVQYPFTQKRHPEISGCL